VSLSRHFTLVETGHSNRAEPIFKLPGDAEGAQPAALCTRVLDPCVRLWDVPSA
jgi:hypothetical protein